MAEEDEALLRPSWPPSLAGVDVASVRVRRHASMDALVRVSGDYCPMIRTGVDVACVAHRRYRRRGQ